MWEIAGGIVLAVIILNLLPLVFTKGFWIFTGVLILLIVIGVAVATPRSKPLLNISCDKTHLDYNYDTGKCDGATNPYFMTLPTKANGGTMEVGSGYLSPTSTSQTGNVIDCSKNSVNTVYEINKGCVNPNSMDLTLP